MEKKKRKHEIFKNIISVGTLHRELKNPPPPKKKKKKKIPENGAAGLWIIIGTHSVENLNNSGYMYPFCNACGGGIMLDTSYGHFL